HGQPRGAPALDLLRRQQSLGDAAVADGRDIRGGDERALERAGVLEVDTDLDSPRRSGGRGGGDADQDGDADGDGGGAKRAGTHWENSFGERGSSIVGRSGGARNECGIEPDGVSSR